MHPTFTFIGEDNTHDGLTLSFGDGLAGLTLEFWFTAQPDSGLITAQTRLTAQAPHRVHWLAAPVMPAPQWADHMIDFAGRWVGEFQMVRTPWAAGVRLRDNRTGRTGHEHFPGLILPCPGTSNTQGRAFGLHYGWSGGHRMIAEELPDQP